METTKRPGTPDTDARRTDVAAMLLDRLGDQHPGLRTREQDWTWDAVVRESAARAELARTLRRDGPFHIGVLLENVPDFLFWLGAAALSGATVAGINPTRGDAQLAADIRYVDCQLIVTDAAGMARLRALDLGLGEDRFLLVDDPGYPALIAAHRVEPTAVGRPDSLMLLLFTSGTSGGSKAVKCSQRRLADMAYGSTDKFGHVRADVEYCCMPLFHGNAIFALWAPSLAVGATVCLTPKFSASRFLADIRHFDATFFTYVGKALGYLLATPEAENDGDTTLVRGFGTEASAADQDEFQRRFGALLYEGYGSSEGANNLATPVPDAPPNALGRPTHAGVAIVHPETWQECVPAQLDEHGRVRNPEEAIGEMIDKVGAAAFEGYYKNDAADAERVRNGWYWTGDLGYLDAEGFLYFAGRKGDWLRVDGENTSTLLIEQVLRRHRAVIAAAVFGAPDPRSGDQVMAAVEVADPDTFDTEEFARFLIAQEDLGSKGAPRLLRVSANLPVTGSNKVLKRELQEQKWRTGEPVYRWIGRGEPEYRLMTPIDKVALESEFAAYGRQRLL